MSEERPKAVRVAFHGRSTGKGAYTDYAVYSLRQRKLLKPFMRHSSKTGNHWTDFYWLIPAKYLVVCQDVTNTGKHHCFVGIIKVNEDGSWDVIERLQSVPDWARPLCHCQMPPEPQE